MDLGEKNPDPPKLLEVNSSGSNFHSFHKSVFPASTPLG